VKLVLQTSEKFQQFIRVLDCKLVTYAVSGSKVDPKINSYSGSVDA